MTAVPQLFQYQIERTIDDSWSLVILLAMPCNSSRKVVSLKMQLGKNQKTTRTPFLLGNIACNIAISLSAIWFDVMINIVGAEMATMLMKILPGEQFSDYVEYVYTSLNEATKQEKSILT